MNHGMQSTVRQADGAAQRAQTQRSPGAAGTDPIALGRQLRHLRRAAEMTLGDLAARIGMSASALSLIENGKREPKLSMLTAIAEAFGIPVTALLTPAPPSRRAALEIALERIQRADSFATLRVPPVKIGPRLIA